MVNNKENELDKQDSAEVKNYTRIPNMLIFGYQDIISPQEKWLYVCFKHMCGKKGTRYLSLRYISEKTGISVGALSKSKNKKGETNEGMIKHLQDAGLIHAEIKKQNGRGNPLYHITITDVWGLNQAFFTRPNSEQDENEENEPVRNSDEPVQNSDKLARNSDKPVQISDEPVRKPLQYQDYIQDYKQDDNNTREQEREIPPNTLDTHTIVSSDTAHASLSQDEQLFTNEKPQGDDHALVGMDASGHSLRDTPLSAPGSVTRHTPVDDGQVATPEGGPVLEAQEEIALEKGQTDGPNTFDSDHRVSSPLHRTDSRASHSPLPALAQTPPTSTPAKNLSSPQDAQAASGTRGRSGKKPAQPAPETPKSPPVEPPSDMAWGTKKCLMWFDFWRGGILIGKWKLMQASTCAKGLAEQFDEQTVIQARTDMEADPYYAAKGGCDVCDVANNIHKYIKRHRQQSKPTPVQVPNPNQPITNIRELVKQRELLRQQQAVGV